MSLTSIIVIGAMVYIIAVQENSIGAIYEYKHTADSLRAVIEAERDTMEYYRALNQRMDNNDPAIIEQVVRENHNMNTPDEDVYITD